MSLIFNAVVIGLIIICAICLLLGLWCDNCIDESLEKDRRKEEAEKRIAERERRKQEELSEYSNIVKFYSEQEKEKETEKEEKKKEVEK